VTKSNENLKCLNISPSYVLWKVLIFSKTANEVLSKTYPGMNKSTEEDVIVQRIVNNFFQIIQSLYTEMKVFNKI